MRILHTSDWHVGRTMRGKSRAAEHEAVLLEVTGVAEAQEVDLVLVGGDLFDLAAPSPQSEQIVYQTLLGLAEIAPVVIVAGNHDHPRRLEAVAPLLELGRVTVASHPRPAAEGGVIRMKAASGESARLALLPFISQRYVVRADDLMGLGRSAHGGKYAERVREIIVHLTQDLSTNEVNIVVGHVMVAGGELGGGERQAHTVFDYVVPAQAFPGALTYAALGHLHRAQRVPAPCPTWYSGSPLQLDFGETEDPKGVLLVEAEPGLPAHVTQIPITSGRRLFKIAGTLAEIEAAAPSTEDAYVRVELHEPARAGLADQIREMIPEAIDVVLVSPEKLDDVERPPRLGRPPHELVAEYLTSEGVEDDKVVALFRELMETAGAP
ncbi:MAG: exonuclease SbcCD subunit D [Acidimicrobiia bacterium]